jgi:hypothetical protein
VLETSDEVIRRVIEFRREIYRGLVCPASNLDESS